MIFINIVILVIAVLLLVAVTIPSIRKYSNYLYGKSNPADYVVGIAVFIVLWLFIIYLFKVDMSQSSGQYEKLYTNLFVQRHKIPIPFFLQQVGIPLLMAQLFLVFIYYPLKSPKVYLKELNNINRFVNFVVYNIEYYQNEKTIVTESLNSIEKDSFYNDVVYLYDQELDSKERFRILTSVYDFKFLFTFLNLFAITLEKGLSEESLLSLGVVQQQGNDYYTNMTHLFTAKKGAAGTIFFINVILVIMMIIVRNALGIGYVYFIHDKYMLFLAYFLGTFGLIVIVAMKTKSNKLLYKEGRYV